MLALRWPRCRAARHSLDKENGMTLGSILIIILLLMLVGALPTWPHSRSWGYFPTGALGAILIAVLFLLLLGRI